MKLRRVKNDLVDPIRKFAPLRRNDHGEEEAKMRDDGSEAAADAWATGPEPLQLLLSTTTPATPGSG